MKEAWVRVVWMGIEDMVGVVSVSIRPEGTGPTGSSCGSSINGVRRGARISVGGWVVGLGLTSNRNASLSFSFFSLLRA